MCVYIYRLIIIHELTYIDITFIDSDIKAHWAGCFSINFVLCFILYYTHVHFNQRFTYLRISQMLVHLTVYPCFLRPALDTICFKEFATCLHRLYLANW